MAHTPGPWDWFGVELLSTAGFVLGTKRDGRPNSEDASLIAAAPDLLAALKAMVVEYCDYTIINNLGDPETQHNIKLARAAIAKAEGAHVAALEAKERT